MGDYMRIRTIKPSFFKHEGLYEAEKETGLPLRAAFPGLWCAADREGRFKWRPRRLAIDIVPYDGVDFEDVLEVLCRLRLVVRYEVDGQLYGHIPTFKQHQRINTREPASELPAPPRKLPANGSDSEGMKEPSKDTHVHARAAHVHGNPLKGKERKGRVKSPNGDSFGSGAPNPSAVRQVFEHWRNRLHPKAKSTADRRRKIQARLSEGYTVEQLKRAVDGCAKSAWHREHGHTGIGLIFRNAEKVDAFLQREARGPDTEDAAQQSVAEMKRKLLKGESL